MHCKSSECSFEQLPDLLILHLLHRLSCSGALLTSVLACARYVTVLCQKTLAICVEHADPCILLSLNAPFKCTHFVHPRVVSRAVKWNTGSPVHVLFKPPPKLNLLLYSKQDVVSKKFALSA